MFSFYLRALLCSFALLALVNCPSAFALNPSDALTGYGRQTWQTENGLPQNTVRAILQTRDGFLWVATEGGLARFDGLQFSVYDTQNTPALKSNNISGLLEDRRGSLWIATAQGLTRYLNDRFETYTSENGLPADSVQSLAMDDGGAVWANTAEGTARFSENRFIPGTHPGLFQNPTSKKFSGPAALPENKVNVAFRDREGTTWIGADSGLHRIGKDQTGKDHTERFPPSDPLSTQAIFAIAQDREGNLWVGTESAGLTVLRNQKFTTFSFREGAYDEQIRCVFEDHNGAVWIGTDGSGLRRFDHGVFSLLTTSEGLSSNIILSLAEDPQGNLLAGTPDGLNRITGHGVSVLTSADGLAEDFIRSIFTDADGTLWIGTRRGLSHVEHNAVTTYTQSNGLGSDLVGAVLRDAQNDLWIATYHGLTRYRSGAFTNYTVEDGLPGNIITDLYSDPQGFLWIATQGGGLARFRDESFTRFPARLQIPETIYGITEDAHGGLWMAAQRGIFRLNKAELTAFAAQGAGNVEIVSYGTSDGLRVSECSGGGHPAIWKDRGGAIWFSTAKGAALLKAHHTAVNALAPPVALASIFIDDQSFDPGRITRVGPDHSRVAFEYTALSFLSPQKIQFKYKLDGFDREWIAAGARRVAYYTNLPPRQYRFLVTARNSDGVWNRQGISFPIRIQPHFYQTWWFRLLMLLALGLCAYGVYYWRVTQVQSQFNAVLQERNRIAREIHDTLAQGFVGVSVQLELVARFLSTSLEATREHLDQARVLVRSSLADARQSIWELRSQQTDRQDFAGRLSQLVRQIGESSGAKVQFQVHGTYRPLSQMVEDQLFRIGQEAITNAVRHAAAEHISIDLTFDSRKVRMTVADDGRGFAGPVNSAGPDGHFGLKGMRERAQQIDADLDISSAAGQGTKIYVEARAK